MTASRASDRRCRTMNRMCLPGGKLMNYIIRMSHWMSTKNATKAPSANLRRVTHATYNFTGNSIRQSVIDNCAGHGEVEGVKLGKQMNMELPTFKVLQIRKIEGEGGAHNMRFCETNRIRHDVIFDVIPYVEGSYERAWRKVNPVRL